MSADGVTPPMDGSQTAELWDKRHRALDRLRSGGHSGYDEAANEVVGIQTRHGPLHCMRSSRTSVR